MLGVTASKHTGQRDPGFKLEGNGLRSKESSQTRTQMKSRGQEKVTRAPGHTTPGERVDYA